MSPNETYNSLTSRCPRTKKDQTGILICRVHANVGNALVQSQEHPALTSHVVKKRGVWRAA